jgi:cytochrome c-type biogenesis protein CcmH/NrfF
VSFQDIEESLTCQCGCGLTVHSCNHLTCPSAIPLRVEIREQMALGKTREQILSHFEIKYGEKVLSAPTTAGFNILAWTTPFVLLAIAAAILSITLMRWRGRQQEVPAESGETPSPDSAYRDILEKELKNFDS